MQGQFYEKRIFSVRDFWLSSITYMAKLCAQQGAITALMRRTSRSSDVKHVISRKFI